MDTLKIFEALKRASSFCEPRAAEILLCHRLGWTRAQLFAGLHDPLPEDIRGQWEQDVEKLAADVPVEHLTGEMVFYGRAFRVNGDVLIPRPETEELVAGMLERIQRQFPDNSELLAVDVGTGSGAIAVTLALEEPRLNVTGIDVSAEALAVAVENASQLGADSVDFIEGDLLESYISDGRKVDVVVSNPPYIPDHDVPELNVNVRDHEPLLALAGGEDGLDMYRRLAVQLPRVLKDCALIGLEVGVGQSDDVTLLMKEAFAGELETEVVYDINGKDRMVFAWRS